MHLIGLIVSKSDVWKWVLRLGGPGLILVGLVDNSVVPMPGGMDVFVILFSANHHDLWIYYGAMATAGAVLGGYVTYRLAQKGGKEAFEKKIGKKKAAKVYKKFETQGSATVMVGSILPPPFPLVPVLMAAGALQYPRKKFLLALSIGRGIRFFALALLGRLYGTTIIEWLKQYYKPLLYSFIALGALGGFAALVYFKWYRLKQQHHAEATAGR